MLSAGITKDIQKLFSIVSTERRAEVASTIPVESMQFIHSGLSSVINALLQLEFNAENSPKLSYIQSFLAQFAKHSDGALSESAFLREFLYAATPILYTVELELEIDTSPELSDSDFLDFIAVAFSSILYGIPESRRITLKTSELKRYSKTRIDLDEEDYLSLSTPSGDFVATRACVFHVNRLSVLCGFFADNGTWRSEKYADEAALTQILEKYNLVCRRL